MFNNNRVLKEFSLVFCSITVSQVATQGPFRIQETHPLS